MNIEKIASNGSLWQGGPADRRTRGKRGSAGRSYANGIGTGRHKGSHSFALTLGKEPLLSEQFASASGLPLELESPAHHPAEKEPGNQSHDGAGDGPKRVRKKKS